MSARRKAPVSCRQFGFSLVELMVVIAIIILVSAFIVPAFTSIKGGGDFTDAAYRVARLLENARTYAKVNRTYVFVGLAEPDSSVDPSLSLEAATCATRYGRLSTAVVAS